MGYYLTVVKDEDETASNENLSRNKAHNRAVPPDLLKDHCDSVKVNMMEFDMPYLFDRL